MSIRLFEDYYQTLNPRFRPTVPEVAIDEIIRFLREKISSLGIVVDVGCGDGKVTNKLSEYFRYCYGFDISRVLINEAKESKRSNVSFNVCSAEDMSQIGANSVQLVTAFSAAHCFQIQQFFKQCDRILVDNGVIALVADYGFEITGLLDPNSFRYWFYDHFFEKYLKPFKDMDFDVYKNNCKDIKFPQNYDYVYKDDISLTIKVSVTEMGGWLQSLNMFQELKAEGQEFPDEALTQLMDKIKNFQNIEDMNEKVLSLNIKYLIAMGRKKSTNQLNIDMNVPEVIDI